MPGVMRKNWILVVTPVGATALCECSNNVLPRRFENILQYNVSRTLLGVASLLGLSGRLVITDEKRILWPNYVLEWICHHVSARRGRDLLLIHSDQATEINLRN